MALKASPEIDDRDLDFAEQYRMRPERGLSQASRRRSSVDRVKGGETAL